MSLMLLLLSLLCVVAHHRVPHVVAAVRSETDVVTSSLVLLITLISPQMYYPSFTHGSQHIRPMTARDGITPAPLALLLSYLPPLSFALPLADPR